MIWQHLHILTVENAPAQGAAVSYWVEVGTLLAAAASAVGTWCLVSIARKHFCHERTSNYIERYNSGEFVQLRAEVDQFLYLTEKLTPLERSQVYLELLFSDHLEDLAFRHKLWTFTMLFNEIGAAWNDKAISDAVAKNFDRLIPRYWMRLRPYIMNLHLRFRFEVPTDDSDFTSEFKLFKAFRSAFIRMRDGYRVWFRIIKRPPFGIDPRDLQINSLLDKDNFAKMEKAMNTCLPTKPRRLAGPSVIAQFTRDGHL